MKKALIIEDHAVVRIGMKFVLEELIPNILVLEADSFPDGISVIREHQIDIIILDVSIPGGEQTRMVSLIKNLLPDCKILIFSALDEEKYALRYLQAGANGYLSKRSPRKDYITAIDAIIRGEKYVSYTIQQNMLTHISNRRPKAAISTWKGLSNRETEITKLLVQGMWNKQIANTLNLKESTVSTFKRKIFDKIGVSNTLELARKIEENDGVN